MLLKHKKSKLRWVHEVHVAHRDSSLSQSTYDTQSAQPPCTIVDEREGQDVMC